MASRIAPPRISDEVVQGFKRARILDAFARLLVAADYERVHIAGIVKAAGVARKTLYDNFAGKEHVARAMLEEVSRDVASRVSGEPLERHGVAVLAVEVAAAIRAEAPRALEDEAKKLLHTFARVDLAKLELPDADDPLRGQLPPGRHGLKPEFIAANQRWRLLAGFASAVSEKGYRATSIADVTTRAACSRRTFYDHSKGMADIAAGLLGLVGVDEPSPRLLPLAAELAAHGIDQGSEAMAAAVARASLLVGELGA